ncbi:MAG TPA: 16S rRNA (uracil(1498)-N(3))-methyltransferase [Rhodocyclaceae bacterium]
MTPRFHCPDPLPPGGRVDLPQEAAHHAQRVLRLREGEDIILFDGCGGEWLARIDAYKPVPCATLLRHDPQDRQPPIQVTLVQGLPSGDKMDWVIQKAVELGVAAIQPVAARRSVVRLSGDKAERRGRHWQGVVVSACEQCGRNLVPMVAPLLDLPQYLATPAQDNESRWVLLPDAPLALRDLPPPQGPLTLLIGPEGGLDEGEQLAAQAAGFTPVRFGPRILRTETAGPAALAAIMALWGDL